MSSIFSGGPEGETKRPGYTRGPGEFLGGNEFPYDTGGYGPGMDALPGFLGDAGLSQMFPYQNVYGGIQQNYPNIQQGGNYFSGLGMHGTNQGYQNTNFLANQGVTNAGMAGSVSPQTLWMLGQQPNAFQGANALANQNMQNAMGASGVLGLQQPAFNVANYYAQNLAPAIHGGNTQGGSGAGQQAMGAGQSVLNAGLGFGADLKAIQDCAIAEGLPQVRASYSARGLGLGGEAARGEQDYVQRISDQMAQEAIQARLGGLGVAAQGANAIGQGAGVAGQEAAAFGNIGLGRGQLAAQATQLPQQVLNQMLQGYGLAGNVMGQAADQPGALINQYLQGQGQGLQNFGQMGNILTQSGNQQFQPLQLAGLGAGVWGQGQQFPLDYANAVFGASRQPMNWLGNWMNAVPNTGTTGQAEGFLGIG